MRHRKPHNDDAPLVDGDDKMKKNSEYALDPKCRKLFTSIQVLIAGFAGLLMADISPFPTTLEEDIIGFLIFEFLFSAITLFFLIRMVDNIILEPVYDLDIKTRKVSLYLFFVPLLVAIFFAVLPTYFFFAYVLLIYLGIYIHLKRFSKKEEFKKICGRYTPQPDKKPQVSKISRILFNIFAVIFIILLMLASLFYSLQSHVGILIWISLVMVFAIILIFAIIQRSDSPKAQKIGDATLALGIIWMSAVVIYAVLSLMGMITV